MLQPWVSCVLALGANKHDLRCARLASSRSVARATSCASLVAMSCSSRFCSCSAAARRSDAAFSRSSASLLCAHAIQIFLHVYMQRLLQASAALFVQYKHAIIHLQAMCKQVQTTLTLHSSSSCSKTLIRTWALLVWDALAACSASAAAAWLRASCVCATKLMHLCRCSARCQTV